MVVANSLKGRVLYQSSEKMLFSRGRNLFISYDEGKSYFAFSMMPVSLLMACVCLSSLACRLFRLGFHHVVPCENGYFVFFNKSVYFVDAVGNVEMLPHSLKGGRPLCVACFDGWCYYGEYSSNEGRAPVSINRFNTVLHETVAMVSGVRHIHGVFYDPYEEGIWFSTGDSDHESGIWKLVDGEARMIVGGSQKFRAVQLVFTKDYIYYGTDTPMENNFICRVERSGYRFEKVVSVSSSVFYGANTSKYISFSTVAEPSLVNDTTKVEVWVSSNWREWSCVMSFKKDLFPMRLFQYGQIVYPYIDGENSSFWVYAMSVWGGNRSYRMVFDG